MVNKEWDLIIDIAVLSVFVGSNLLQATPEGDALNTIKERLHLEVNWTGNDPCQAWEGVNCFLNHVTEVNLSSKRLYGIIPAEIGQLSFLEALDLSNNRLQGNLPNEIANLTNLHTLNLRYNLLSGGFPQVILKLRKLVSLRVDNTQLSGFLPSDIQQLSSLEYLYLGNCSFNGYIPVEMGKLINLKALSIWGNFLNSTIPVELSKLTNLEILNLHDTSMYGTLPSEFGRLHKMKNLSLQTNLFTGTVPVSWSSMVNLQNLNLFNNRLSGGFPTWLSMFSRRMSLGCNYFTGTNPKSFPQNDFRGNCLDADLDSHMRFCRGSPNCISFYSQPENAQSEYTLLRHKQTPILATVGAAVGCGVLLVVVILAVSYALKIKNKRGVNSQLPLGGTQATADTVGNEPAELWEIPHGIRRFDLEEILKATESFSKTHEVGFGGFGRVYKGYLDSGDIVAVKRASPSSIQGHKEFQNEIVVLSRLHHRSLVKLEGFCQEAGEQILVYEFMINGNLHNWIWEEKRRWSLSWCKRIEIAIAIAEGLDYLHSFVDPPIIHRDVKPSNILLGEHFNAKLSDFGICKTAPEFIYTHISTGPVGTIGYLDPQYFLRRCLTTSSDVYSYGVVLLVLITGQKAVDHSRLEEFNLIEWVKLKFLEDDSESIADPHLGHNYLPHDFRIVTDLALKCTAFESSARPSMRNVVQILEPLLKRNSESCFGEVSARNFLPSRDSSATVEAFTA